MDNDENLICKVSIPNTYAQAYDYALHEDHPPIGARVCVPFRDQDRMGIVIDYAKPEKKLQLKNVKNVLDDTPLFTETYLKWLKWIAQYYHTPFSEILSLAIPKKLKEIDAPLALPYDTYITLQAEKIEIPKRQKKLQELQIFLQNQTSPVLLKDLKTSGFSKELIEKAMDLNLIRSLEKPKEWMIESQQVSDIELNPEQQIALDAIEFSLFAIYLLKGVTGSGKTEVYIEAIKKTLTKGQQVLMLVPEIGLTTGLHQRLQKRLNLPIQIFHSSLTEKQRYEHWIMAYHGQAKVILGTRSAIFAPLPNLGLVIVDEEHDLSFKQQEGVRYSAKDAVMMRAKLQNIPVLLGTATPTLETFYNAQKGRYQLLALTQKALSSTALCYHLVDLRRQKVQHGIADETLQLIQKHLDLKQQVLVFINRRGYAPLLFCHDCGSSIECKRCDANMTVYRSKYQLICHHCGYGQKTPEQCAKCFSHQLIPIGFGTEQVYDYLTHFFPSHSVLRFDRDVIKNKIQLEEGLQKIQDKQANIIVATQMLAKGHHFSDLSLVVILDGDSGFYQADFRALERLGQMVTQVSGRAGRESIPGEVCIQTHLPQHPLLLTLIQKGYEPYIEQLLKQRQEAQLPPYSYLALLRIQGKHAPSVIAFVKNLAQEMKTLSIEFWGPSPAPIERKADVHRWQLVVKSSQRDVLHHQLAKMSFWLKHHCPKNLRWFIEVDPYDWSA